MRQGEKLIVGLMAVSVVVLSVYKFSGETDTTEDPGIPFYTIAPTDLQKRATKIVHAFDCQSCHSLWATRSLTQSVPAPALDGMGMFRTEAWLYAYFSAPNPQEVLSSRLKPEYRMPSYAKLPESDRRDLAAYIASLKVEDWYLEETSKARYEKLTGKVYKENADTDI